MYLLLLYINRSNVSKLVTLHLGLQPTTVLCHMGDFGCGDGGWTPVMKINGNKVPCGIDLLSIKYHDLSLGGIHRRRERLGGMIFGGRVITNGV